MMKRSWRNTVRICVFCRKWTSAPDTAPSRCWLPRFWMPASGDLVGVIQVINNKAGVPFTAMIEEGVQELAQTMAVALRQHQRQQHSSAKTKYDYLVADAVLSAAEFELATRTARRKGIDIEEVLLDEFQVSVAALGKALSSFFGVPYEPYRGDRLKPTELLKNLRREYVESSHWIPIEETQEGLMILTTDPERIQASRVVNNIFPKNRLGLPGLLATRIQANPGSVLWRRRCFGW